jgi:hypothetical protein
MRMRRAAIALAVLGLAPSCGATPSSPPIAPRATIAMPGPSAGVAASDRLQRNAGCVRCHDDAAATWSASLHRRAWTEPDFARAQAREPAAFCRSCHAPEADPAREPEPELAAIGVACVTCHVPPAALLPAGAVLAGVTAHGDHDSPHAIVRSPAFAGASGCASCHEFSSPRNPELAMQATATEHAASRFADVSCQGCHMPPRGMGLDHGFAASRDATMLRSALVVTASRPAPDRVEVALAPGHVGHAFPTGDPFRRLVVEILLDDEAVDAEILTRTIENRMTHGLYSERVVVHDNRIGADDFSPTLVFHVPDAAGSPVEWRVIYERVDLTVDVEEPDVFGRLEIASGTLDPEPR